MKYLVRLQCAWKTYLLLFLKWKLAGFVGDPLLFVLEWLVCFFLITVFCVFFPHWRVVTVLNFGLCWDDQEAKFLLSLAQPIIFSKLFLAWTCFRWGRCLLLKVCKSLPKEPFFLISTGRKLVEVLIMKLVWFYGWRFLSFSEGKIFTEGIRAFFLVLWAFENIPSFFFLEAFHILDCCLEHKYIVQRNLKVMFLSCWHNLVPVVEIMTLFFTQSSQLWRLHKISATQ